MAFNEEKMFTLMEKVYSELITFKGEVAEKFDSIDKRFDKIENRLTKLEVSQEKVHGNIKTLAEGLASNTEKLRVLENKIDDLSQNVDKHDIKIQVIEGGKYKAN